MNIITPPPQLEPKYQEKLITLLMNLLKDSYSITLKTTMTHQEDYLQIINMFSQLGLHSIKEDWEPGTCGHTIQIEFQTTIGELMGQNELQKIK